MSRPNTAQQQQQQQEPLYTKRELLGHRAPVTAVAWASNGRRLASASEDGVVMLWTIENSSTARPEHSDHEIAHRAAGGGGGGGGEVVTALAFHPQRDELLAVVGAGTTRVYDLRSKSSASVVFEVAAPEAIAAAWEPRGEGLLIAQLSNTFTHVEPRRGRAHRPFQLRPGDEVTDVAFCTVPSSSSTEAAAHGSGSGGSGSSTRLLVATRHGVEVRGWPAHREHHATLSGHALHHGRDGGVTALAVGRGDRMLVTGGADAQVVLWDLQRSAAPVAVAYQPDDAIRALGFSCNGHMLAYSQHSGGQGGAAIDVISSPSARPLVRVPLAAHAERLAFNPRVPRLLAYTGESYALPPQAPQAQQQQQQQGGGGSSSGRDGGKGGGGGGGGGSGGSGSGRGGKVGIIVLRVAAPSVAQQEQQLLMHHQLHQPAAPSQQQQQQHQHGGGGRQLVAVGK